MEPGKEPESQAQTVPSEPETPVRPSTLEKMPAVSKDHPILATAVILAIVFAVGIIAYLAYQNFQLKQQLTQSPSPTPSASATPDPTAGWKIYTDTQRGFSFKYPENINLEENVGTVSLDTWGPTQKAQTEFYDGISLHFTLETLENQTLEQWVDKSISEAEASGVATIKDGKQKISLNGYTGFKYTVEGLGTFRYILLQSPFKANQFMRITNGTQDPTKQGFEQTVNQILSTFKFIDQNGERPNVTITSPTSGSTVTSPLRLEGTVPAGWMFEGVLPIKLLDENRKLIAQGKGKESKPGSWQSGSPVAFEGKIIFETTAKSGFLVVEKDNPSGLPENSGSYEIPVKF